MASMRRVRKDFRKEVYRRVSTGEGNSKTLTKLAREFFGHDVGYEVLIDSFAMNEMSNAVSYLRAEGMIETVGKKWKPAEELNPEDVEIISIRRLKRLRGELESEVKLAHKHGLAEEAIAASKMLAIVSEQLSSHEQEATASVPPVA